MSFNRKIVHGLIGQLSTREYSEITKNMVGRVLTNRNVVNRDGGDYLLLGYENLTPDQVQRLNAAGARQPN